jgi:hypothetical protein
VREVEGQSYTIEGETLEPALAAAEQAYADNGGEWSSQGEAYVYTFANSLSIEADPNCPIWRRAETDKGNSLNRGLQYVP